jgi:hypothetical protein
MAHEHFQLENIVTITVINNTRLKYVTKNEKSKTLKECSPTISLNYATIGISETIGLLGGPITLKGQTHLFFITIKTMDSVPQTLNFFETLKLLNLLFNIL